MQNIISTILMNFFYYSYTKSGLRASSTRALKSPYISFAEVWTPFIIQCCPSNVRKLVRTSKFQQTRSKLWGVGGFTVVRTSV